MSLPKPHRVILIHGIHAAEGTSNVGVLLPHLRRNLPETDVLLHEYGFMGFWEARWRNNLEARRLAEQIGENDILVTHSNGAAIAYLAVRDYGARPAGIININPALDRWRTAPVPWVETIYSWGDRWVWLSQWLPFHIWGDQGKVGYRGKKTNTLNHDAWAFGPGMRYESHLGLFHPKRIEQWAVFLGVRIEERIEEAEYRQREADKLRDIINGLKEQA